MSGIDAMYTKRAGAGLARRVSPVGLRFFFEGQLVIGKIIRCGIDIDGPIRAGVSTISDPLTLVVVDKDNAVRPLVDGFV